MCAVVKSFGYGSHFFSLKTQAEKIEKHIANLFLLQYCVIESWCVNKLVMFVGLKLLDKDRETRRFGLYS